MNLTINLSVDKDGKETLTEHENYLITTIGSKNILVQLFSIF